MSYSAILSNCKDPKNRNKHKTCICGSHSANDVKKNKHHHATYNRYKIRKLKRTFLNLN